MRQAPLSKKKPPPKGRPPAPSEMSAGLAQSPQPQADAFHHPEAQPTAGTQPSFSGPPIPALQAYGYSGSVHDLNARVRSIVDAYGSRFGGLPSWGHVFNVLVSPIEAENFKGLYDQVPRSTAAARAQGSLSRVATDANTSGPQMLPEDRFISDFVAAVNRGDLKSFEDDHGDLLSQYGKDPKFAGKIWAALHAPTSAIRGAPSAQKNPGRFIENPNADKEAADLMLEQAGLMPDIRESAKVGGGVFARGATQIVSSLIHSPAGLKTLAWGAAQDEARMLGGKPPTKTPALAKGMGKSMEQDVRHPIRNPGFLLLDILGFAGGVSGAAARVGRSTRALKAGEGVGEAARTLASRPVGGTAALKKGALQEQVLLSDNPSVALVQKYILNARNRKMALRHEGEPAGVLSFLMPQRAADLIDRALEPLRQKLGTEAKLGREIAARQRVEFAVSMTAKRVLEDAAGSSLNTARVFARLPKAARKGLTRGEQKAIQVSALDSADPLAAMRNFHEFARGAGIGDPAAHLRQLADLKLAERVLNDSSPRPRFLRALQLTRDVIAEQERIKIEDLGLSPLTADKRVVAAGKVFRGETIITPTNRAAAEARLADLQAQYEGLISDVAARVDPYGADAAKVEQLRRNAANAKSGRARGSAQEGRATGRQVKLPKVSDEVRGLAEAEIDRLLAARPDDPGLRKFAQIRDQMNQLEQELANPGLSGTERAIFEEAPTKENPESFYLPFQRRGQKMPPSERRGGFGAGVGPYGLAQPRGLPELRHYFTGDSINAGDFRIDATALAGESYARTVRLATVMNEYADLIKASTPTKRSEFDRPIRERSTIPDALRQRLARIEEGTFTAKDAEALRKEDADAILRHLYPDPNEGIEKVRWIDERLLGDRLRPTGPVAGAKLMQAVNEPFRVTILFLRPAYALNALGNAGMMVMQQGVLTPVNLFRALYAKHLYGEKTAHTLDALMGEGKTRSYVAADVDTLGNAVSRKIAKGWSVMADQFFRRGALIHELRRQGFRTNAELEDALFNKDNLSKLVEAKKRANKALVEFDNLTWMEKNVLRHYIFVYPWVSRSFVWSLRTLLEHPIQSDLLVQLGREAEQHEDPAFAQAPQWFKQTGYFPVGYDDKGRPQIVNPTSVNTFSTLGELLTTGEAGFSNQPYGSLEDLLGPYATLTVHSATGRDEFGNRYPDGAIVGAMKELVSQLPQASALARSKKKQAQIPAVDVTDRRTLIQREQAALKTSVLGPGWLNGFGSLIAGGLAPRAYDPDAAAARYWKTQPIEKRHKFEMGLIRKALTFQGDFLQRKVPPAVAEAVDLAGERDLAYKVWTRDHGRDPTLKERTFIDIRVLRGNARLTDDQAKQMGKQLHKLADEAAVRRFRGGLLDQRAGAPALRAWDADVRLVYSFRSEIVQSRLDSLKGQKLIPQEHGRVGGASQSNLFEFGRRVLAYKHEIEQRTSAMGDMGSSDRTTAEAELRAYEDAQDMPVKVEGKTFPSVVRFAWTFLTPKQQQEARISNATGDWSKLSDFDKEIIGLKPIPNESDGWAAYGQLHDYYSEQLGLQGKRLAPNQRAAIVKLVQQGVEGWSKPHPGFVRAYQLAHRPKFLRLQDTSLIKSSPYKSQWADLLDTPSYYWKAIKEGYPKTQTAAVYRQYVTSEGFKDWLKAEPVGFRREVAAFGPNFLTTLLER